MLTKPQPSAIHPLGIGSNNGESVRKLKIDPVNAVKIDHHRTIRRMTDRVPHMSESQPMGISNSAYPTMNAENTTPISTSLRPKSRWISSWTREMQMRSRYVSTDRLATSERI